MTVKVKNGKHPPIEIFDDEAINKAAEKFLWEARRLISSDVRDIRNLISFSSFFFDYMPAKTMNRMEEAIGRWVDSGVSTSETPPD